MAGSFPFDEDYNLARAFGRTRGSFSALGRADARAGRRRAADALGEEPLAGALFTALWAAFPDPQATIHDQVAEGDKVVTRKTLSGTHAGPFMGLPPTGNRVAFDIIDVLRVADGKLVEHWCVVDQLALLRGVGALPQASA